jgi:two-component system KDP operon response regulator KdpE
MMLSRVTEHILIIEDEPIIGEMLRATLEYHGYSCEIATNAAWAIERFHNRKPDAVVTDLGLPDTDGVELISVLRRLSQVPIIVVSGRSGEADKIAALDHGADDYIVKPFLPAELVARIRAKLRFYRHDQTEELGAHVKLDPEDLSLSKMERHLLAFLVQRRGVPVSEPELITAVWGSPKAATSTDLRALILRVRRKLQVQGQPLYVLNQRGVGYYASSFGRLRHRAAELPFVAETPASAQPAFPRLTAKDPDQAPEQPALSMPSASNGR